MFGSIQRLQSISEADKITNPTLFKAVISLFPEVAARVVDRHGKELTAEHFREVLTPFFAKARRSFKNVGKSHIALHESFSKTLRQQFTIAGI